MGWVGARERAALSRCALRCPPKIVVAHLSVAKRRVQRGTASRLAAARRAACRVQERAQRQHLLPAGLPPHTSARRPWGLKCSLARRTIPARSISSCTAWAAAAAIISSAVEAYCAGSLLIQGVLVLPSEEKQVPLPVSQTGLSPGHWGEESCRAESVGTRTECTESRCRCWSHRPACRQGTVFWGGLKGGVDSAHGRREEQVFQFSSLTLPPKAQHLQQGLTSPPKAGRAAQAGGAVPSNSRSACCRRSRRRFPRGSSRDARRRG